MVCAPGVRVMPSLYVVFEEESSSSVKIIKIKERGRRGGRREGRRERGREKESEREQKRV